MLDGRSVGLTTPLKRARGLGSAKGGTEHWWAQRLSSIALIPLTIWFLAGAIGLVEGGGSRAEAISWLALPFNAVAMILFVAATLHHTVLGLQVVIEDYVHDEAAKIAALLALKLSAMVLATAAIFAVLRVAFTA